MTWGSRGAALAVGMLACAVVSGCAAGHAARKPAAPRDPGPFPTREALAALEPAPVAEALPEMDLPMVDQWDLAGPFPERIGLSPAEYRGGFGAQVAALARERGGGLVLSEDMACFAREAGRFLLARGAQPPSGLERHMAGRCGSPWSRHAVVPFTGEAPARVTEEQLVAGLKDKLAEHVRRIASEPGQKALGVWFGRSGKKVMVVLASAPVNVDLEPLSFAPAADGTVVLSGTLAAPAERLDALVTRGRLDYAECRTDPAVKLPRFQVRCPVSRADATAWVSVIAFPPNQVLGALVADALLLPQGKGAERYARPDLRPGAGAPEEEAARFAFLLNGLRAELGLQPVTLSAGESRLAQRVAPNYFAAMYGKAPERVANLVALGMLAGWEVDQVTRDAFFTEWVSTGDLSTLLAEMTESPSARRVLFDPGVRAMAFGSYRLPGHPGMAAMVTTYAPFEELPPGAEAKQVMDALNRARAERGLEPAELAALPAGVRTEMDQALAEGGSLDDVVQAVMRHVQRLTGGGVRGGALEAGSLAELKFPEELLSRSNLVLHVAVTHYKPRGLPWGIYVVGIAYSTGFGETAEAGVTSEERTL